MTAVEWVFDKMLDIAAGNSSLTTQEILEKGREMEREQIEDAFQDGKWDWDDHIKNGMVSKDLAEYYNSTYKGGEQ